MNKSISLLLLFVIFSCSIGLSSCAKKEGVDTPFTRLVGKWKRVKLATDDNNNGQIEDREIFPDVANITNTIEFKKDSTGVEKTTFSPDLPFRWQITGEGAITLFYAANFTISYRVVSVTSHDLNLTTRATTGLVGYYYESAN